MSTDLDSLLTSKCLRFTVIVERASLPFFRFLKKSKSKKGTKKTRRIVKAIELMIFMRMERDFIPDFMPVLRL